MKCDLVFEGGGAKGMVFVGALTEFEQQGLRPRRVVGTSAGAITATLLAAGYTANEMLEARGEGVLWSTAGEGSTPSARSGEDSLVV